MRRKFYLARLRDVADKQKHPVLEHIKVSGRECAFKRVSRLRARHFVDNSDEAKRRACPDLFLDERAAEHQQ